MDSLIQVGASKGAVEALAGVVLKILDYGRDREVTIKALETLREGLQVNNTVVSNCVLSNYAEEKKGGRKRK